MNVNIIARHYLDQITALLYQSKELDKQDFVDSLQSFFIFSLTRLPPEIFQIFSFQWAKGALQLVTTRPVIQQGQRTIQVYSTIFLSPMDSILKRLNFLLIVSKRIVTTNFQRGLVNALFVNFPRNLNFVLRYRRHWIQGFSTGLISIIGYRTGEISIIFRKVSDLIQCTSCSPLPILMRYLSTFFFVGTSCLSLFLHFF